MSRTMQFMIGVLAILVAAGAGLYGRDLYLRQVSTYQMPVPVAAIVPYTMLAAGQFQMREMPRSLSTMPYYQTIQDLAGKVATENLAVGLPVPLSSVKTSHDFRLADASLEVVSIPVEPVSAVGGQIQIGQRVNLYQMVIDEAAKKTQTFASGSQVQYKVEEIARSVPVVDVRTSAGASASPIESKGSNSSGVFSTGSSQASVQAQILTIAVKPEAVQGILSAVVASKKQGGLLWTTLATP